MSSDFAIEIRSLSKKYKIYKKPSDRLWQFLYSFLYKIFKVKIKDYNNEKWALRDININIRKGESVGIIGQNGAGKSTLLQIISNVLEPSSGQLNVDGRVAAMLELGTGFSPEFTGRENIYLNALMHGLAREQLEEKIDKIIEFSEIGEYVDRKVKTYSSGMSARLAFSVFAHLRPDILIVDEALSVGDVFFQQKCNHLFKTELSNITKLFVSHDLASVSSFCDRVIVIDAGEVVYDGAVKEGIDCYLRMGHSQGRITDPATQEEDSRQLPESEGSSFSAISPDTTGGKGSVLLKSFSVEINNESYVDASTVRPGDNVKIRVLADSFEDKDSVIFGYLVVDKKGNQIFGDNTFDSLAKLSMGNGDSFVVEIDIVWPTIKDDSYTLTLGVGSGLDAISHSVECWAHGVFKFDSISVEPVHALFTNKIQSKEFIKV